MSLHRDNKVVLSYVHVSDYMCNQVYCTFSGALTFLSFILFFLDWPKVLRV